MKKMISTLMIGLIAATATMSAMAAPSFDHKHSPAPHHFNKKPMPPKHDLHHGSQHQVPAHHFKKVGHKAPFHHDMKHNAGPHHKMPPKHR